MYFEFKAMKNRKRYIKPEQAMALIKFFYDRYRLQVKYSTNDLNKAYLIYTLWRTGRRISEIVGIDKQDYKHNIRYFNENRCPGLRPMDLDDEFKEMTFHILKKHPVKKYTKKGREKVDENLFKEYKKKPIFTETIGYDNTFYEKLSNYVKKLDIEPHERIFPYNRIYVNEFVKGTAKKLGLSLGYKTITDKETGDTKMLKLNLDVHCFRHGFSMNFLKKNKNNPMALPMLQDLLCHSSINVTKTYMKFDQKDRKEMLNKTFGGD